MWSGGEARCGLAPQRPEPAGVGHAVSAPEIVAGQVDVLPTERSDVCQERLGDILTGLAQDGKSAIAEPAEAMEADGTRERVAGFALAALGRSYRLIGRELGLSKNTVAAIVKRSRATTAEDMT